MPKPSTSKSDYPSNSQQLTPKETEPNAQPPRKRRNTQSLSRSPKKNRTRTEKIPLIMDYSSNSDDESNETKKHPKAPPQALNLGKIALPERQPQNSNKPNQAPAARPAQPPRNPKTDHNKDRGPPDQRNPHPNPKKL